LRKEEQEAPEHPRGAVLVVEVADVSLSKDRLVKGRIYAQANVPEYWIVDIRAQQLEVYTEPDPSAGRYRASKTMNREGVLTPTTLPGLVVELGPLFEK
jgi:Uma2 family endonuclease